LIDLWKGRSSEIRNGHCHNYKGKEPQMSAAHDVVYILVGRSTIVAIPERDVPIVTAMGSVGIRRRMDFGH